MFHIQPWHQVGLLKNQADSPGAPQITGGLAFDADLACGRLQQVGQDLEQGAFSTARWPHDGDERTGADIEVYAVQSLYRVALTRLENLADLSNGNATLCGHGREGVGHLAGCLIRLARVLASSRASTNWLVYMEAGVGFLAKSPAVAMMSMVEAHLSLFMAPKRVA